MWHNQSTGEVALWLMNGTTLITPVILNRVPLFFQIVGVCDLDGNGMVDIVWRDTSTGGVIGWLMNGLSIASQGGISGDVPLVFELE